MPVDSNLLFKFSKYEFYNGNVFTKK